MPAATVAFVTANTFEFDSRHTRAAEALAADGWSVVVVAMAAAHLPAEERRPADVVVRRPFVDRTILGTVPKPLRRLVGRLTGLAVDAERLPSEGGIRAPARRALEILAYRRRVEPWAQAVVRAAPGAQVFVAKALVALPVVVASARMTGGRYVYDVADLHIESGRLARLPAPLKAYLRRREANWMRGAAALLAVTPAMADEVRHAFRVARPTVVMNARERWRPNEALPRPTLLRLAISTGVEDHRDVIIYQGAFRPDQGIDTLLGALKSPRLSGRSVTVVFIGFGPLEKALRDESLGTPGRIVILPAVSSNELLGWTAGADVAFVGTPPTTRNQTLTTPNKLFEAVMAGVPVIVAGGTWTAQLVGEHRLGAVVDPWTPEAVAAAIAELLDASAADRDARRRAIRATALSALNWDVERARLLSVFRALR